jgi:hypothetical protein
MLKRNIALLVILLASTSVAATGCFPIAKPVVIAPAPPEAKAIALRMELAGDAPLARETLVALEQALVAAGFDVSQADRPHDAVLRVSAKGEEFQPVVVTYTNGQPQRPFRVQGSLVIVEGEKSLETIPIDFEGKNLTVERNDVARLANAVGASPQLLALARRKKFDRALANQKAERGEPPAEAP